MATLYVEKVPEGLYKALREQARRNRRSIAAEVLTLLEVWVPTEKERKGRREFVKRLDRLRARTPLAPGPFPTTEEMLREDRER